MLVLVISLLSWTQTEGSCSAAIVSITGHNKNLLVGEGFNLMCEFKCLGAQHVAQLWRSSADQNEPLVNFTSVLPNVSLALNIRSATKAHAGYYFCKTQPPDTISPRVEIKVADNLTAKPTQPTNSSLQPSSVDEYSRPCGTTSHTGLKGQIWFWMLLGKTTILLLSFAFLAIKHKRG